MDTLLVRTPALRIPWVMVVIGGQIDLSTPARCSPGPEEAPAQFLEPAFKNSGNATLESINVQPVVDAAAHAFPAWLPYLLDAKFALATLGSLLVIILLAVPEAQAYFRKDGP